MLDRTSGSGEGAAPVALRCECADRDEGSEAGGRRPATFPVQPAFAIGDSGHLLCALPGKGILAIGAGGAVSAADQALSGLAGGRGGDPLGDRHRSSSAGAPASLSRRRMVLVPGQPSSNDWVGTNGGSGDGGSLCLHSVDRPFS